MKENISVNSDNNEIHFREYLKVILDHLWFLLLFLCITTTGTIIVLINTPKTYLASVSLLLNESNNSPLASSLGSLPLPGLISNSDSINKLLVILESKTIAERVVQQEHLIEYIKLLKSAGDETLGIASIKARVKSMLFGKDAQVSNEMIDSDQKDIDEAIIYLHNHISIDKEQTGLITLKLEWLDPKQGSDILNTYVFSLSRFLNDLSIAINFFVIDAAKPATRKYKPKIVFSLITSCVFFGMISILGIFIKESLKK